jgi:cell division protein FtsA
MRGRYIAGLDIGTTKVSAVVARTGGGSPEIFGLGVVPSNGMKNGVVVDMDAVTRSVKGAVKKAAQSSGVDIKSVYLGVAAEHIECLDSYGATGIKGKEVVKKDIDRALEVASALYVPLDREVLHVLPTDFVIDGQGGIVRPLGMSGVRLEANVRVVTASQAALENLARCCQKAGLTVMDTVFGPIATFKAAVRPDESFVALVDMGGGATDVAVFNNGALLHAAVLPIGGSHLTNDIAIGLKLSLDEAERVKQKFGYAISDADTGEQMQVRMMDGRIKTLQRSSLGGIILPRCEEMFTMARESITHPALYSSPTCVVLTGGTAQLEGIDRVAEAVFGLPVRVGIPEKCSMVRGSELESPAMSTSVGLMLYGHESEASVYDELFDGTLGKFSKWIRRIANYEIGLKNKRKEKSIVAN